MNNLRQDQYWTQRNNSRDPLNSCMNTSYAMFLEGNGIDIPNNSKLADDDYIHMLLNTEKAQVFRNQKYPHLRSYPPNEIHGMYHSYLEPLLFGRQVSDFLTYMTRDSYKAVLDKGQVIFTSGTFAGLAGHAVCVIGYDDNGFRIADPYGNYHTGYKDHKGYDILLPYKDFDALVKPKKLIKWGHVIL